MSGAEIAGLALGVLPLLISAVEHYDDCLRPFQRYKNFEEEVDRFGRILGVQKTIYRNQCRLLLKEVAEHDVASQVLDAGFRGEPLSQQNNVGLEKELAELLGDSKEACVTALELIGQRLRDIESENKDLWHALDEDQQATADRACYKAWKRRIAKKLRFSFSKARLDLVLSDLRSSNDDLRTLSFQVLSPVSTPKHKAKAVSAFESDEVQKYHIVGQASRQVYEALGKACTKHTEHQAHFCVEAEQAVIHARHSAKVRFNMAFTHMTLAGTICQGDLIWFAVDSSTGDASTLDYFQTVPGCSKDSISNPKRSLVSSNVALSKKAKKSVRFRSSAPMPECVPIPPSATLMKAFASEDNMRKDFCDFLRQRMCEQNGSDVCVGVLQNTGTCKNFIYPPSQKLYVQSRQSTSLGQLISKMTDRRDLSRISLCDRLHIAKLLAIAVVQYHSTPWLRESWRSEDVYFFGLDDWSERRQLPSLSSPHLNVKVKGPDGHLSRPSTFPSYTLARNPLLFSLAVILLELAHCSTLKSLQQSSDLDNGQENRYTEFFVARRLSRSRFSDMGITYHRVVERLVECDFGCGTDLGEAQLQAAFHKDVICPLEKLEKKLYDFHRNS